MKHKIKTRDGRRLHKIMDMNSRLRWVIISEDEYQRLKRENEAMLMPSEFRNYPAGEAE